MKGTTTLEELWKRLLALHVFRYFPILLAAGFAWLKRKAIAAALGTLKKAATARFWGWVRKKVSAGPQTNQRTYWGIFLGYYQYENFPHEWCFQLDDGGVKTKVPSMRTNLFSGVAPGNPRTQTRARGNLGLIERVTFHNDESGFCVLRVKAPGQREETTVVGSLPSVAAGEWLSAEGRWVRDKEHGL